MDITQKDFDNLTDEVYAILCDECPWTDVQRDKFRKLACFLLQENKKYNLTAITGFDGVIKKHFYDSISIQSAIPRNASMLDVGSGAGFPSLPLAIMRPDLKITAMDSTEKKTKFIGMAKKLIEVDNVTELFGRAEELSKPESAYREKFELCNCKISCAFRC